MGRPARTTPRFELLRRLARRAGVPARDAEDIAQEALLRGWESRERIEPGGDPAPYAVTIARNQARNHTRNARRRGEVLTSFDDLDLGDECPSPEDLIRRREREALMRTLIGQVDPTYRDILVKHDLEEMPFAEIAAELGLKLNTVKTRHRRAREHLDEATRRWMAQQESRGWDKEPCVPVAFGLHGRSWWADVLHLQKVGARLLAQAAFVGLIGAVVATPPSSTSTANTTPLFQPAAVRASEGALLPQDTAPFAGPPDVPPAVATTALLVQSVSTPGEHPPVAMSGKAASPATIAAHTPSRVGSARPVASEREKSLIRQARKAIEAHNARADVEARRLLDMHAMEFPRGQLAGEREALLLQLR
ncbi:sigma-70 family RNA polymerase sigma factor [Sorangium sp. So ce1014]|uniref:RNA polymerase sigma factor n=1 Tax=Sorangium sp. So ce1014 TaxID=3133326 RepID=UPI003F63D6DD